MGKIIQRDFFPDLEKLKAQNAYLDAVLENDVHKLQEVYAKYSSGSRLPTERRKYSFLPRARNILSRKFSQIFSVLCSV